MKAATALATPQQVHEHVRALWRTDLFRRVQRWFETADYLVTPTLSCTALPIDQDLFEPIKIDGVAPRYAPAAALGADTAAVLADVGVDPEQLEALRIRGVV